jgi:hypothetical protein
MEALFGREISWSKFEILSGNHERYVGRFEKVPLPCRQVLRKKRRAYLSGKF